MSIKKKKERESEGKKKPTAKEKRDHSLSRNGRKTVQGLKW